MSYISIFKKKHCSKCQGCGQTLLEINDCVTKKLLELTKEAK